MPRFNWDQILPHFREAVEFLRNELRVNPEEITFRTIFYHLGSRNIIPITLQAYKSLNRAFVRWRKTGKLPFKMVKDIDRVAIKQLSITPLDHSKLDIFQQLLDETGKEVLANPDELVNRILSQFFDYLLPSFNVGRWYGQKYICEIWSEKKSLLGTIKAIANGLGINLRFSRGYFGWEFIYEGVEEIRRYFTLGFKKVYIFYIGDLDPSGENIEEHLRSAMDELGVPKNKIEFTRLAVLPEQVKEFNLPPKPETEETIRKLLRDPRSVRYFGLSSYSELRKLKPEQLLKLMDETGKVAVEAEAFFGYAPRQARELIRKTILSIWDRKIYEKYKQEAQELREKAKEILEQFKEQFKPKLVEALRKTV